MQSTNIPMHRHPSLELRRATYRRYVYVALQSVVTGIISVLVYWFSISTQPWRWIIRSYLWSRQLLSCQASQPVSTTPTLHSRWRGKLIRNTICTIILNDKILNDKVSKYRDLHTRTIQAISCCQASSTCHLQNIGSSVLSKSTEHAVQHIHKSSSFYICAQIATLIFEQLLPVCWRDCWRDCLWNPR